MTENRYTTVSPARRVAVRVLVMALAIMALTWLFRTAYDYATPAVAGRIKAFTVADENLTRVTLTVDRRRPADIVECTLFVQAENYERVGEKTVQVEPGATRITDVPVEIRTFRRGTSASLEHCRVSG